MADGSEDCAPPDAEDEPDQPYRVVYNDEEQYSIFPCDRPLPDGWYAEGKEGGRKACLAHIDTIWTDMRPRSTR